MYMKRAKKALGYTLAEVLVVTSIVSFIFLFSVPSFNSQVSFHQTKESATSVAHVLKLCKSHAMSYLKEITCEIEIVSSTPPALVAKVKVDINNDATAETLSTSSIKISSHTDFDLGSANPLAIPFDVYGRVDSGYSGVTTLTFCSTTSNANNSDYEISLNSLSAEFLEPIATNTSC